MRDMMFDLPSSDDIAGITINRPVVLGEAKPIIRRKETAEAA